MLIPQRINRVERQLEYHKSYVMHLNCLKLPRWSLSKMWRYTILTVSTALLLFVIAMLHTGYLDNQETVVTSFPVSQPTWEGSLNLSEKAIDDLSPVFPSLTNERVSKLNLSTIGRITTYNNLEDENDTYSRGEPRLSLHNMYILYQPMMTPDEKYLFLMTFQTFIRACQLENLTYFLYGGTLLGAYRHHGVIPWDDDIDVMMNSSDKARAKKALSQFPSYGVHTPSYMQWKFYRKGLPTLQHKPFRWPFIDIFFFVENSEYMWDETNNYRHDFNYSIASVFPLQFRLFERAILPVPCNMERVLSTNYMINVCKTTNYIHKLESEKPMHLRKSVNCKHLHYLFPFVFRTQDAYGNIVEVQKHGDKVLNTVMLPPFGKHAEPV